MKRVFSVLAVTALMVAMLAVSAGSAFAVANPDNNGNTENATGQPNARENCKAAILNQDRNTATNGKKYGFQPANCDHFHSGDIE